VERLKEDPYKLSKANERLRERLRDLESEFGDWRNKLLKENSQLEQKLKAHEEVMLEAVEETLHPYGDRGGYRAAVKILRARLKAK